MAQFTLTARTAIDRPGCHIARGTSFDITINLNGITPYNLFNNSRCDAQLRQQFKVHGIDLPKSDFVYTRGAWDIQPLRR